MDIIVVGTGISGMAAARWLDEEHGITVLEKSDRPGGHAHTVDVQGADRAVSLDTGFIVYNERTYPQFCELLDQLEVQTAPSDMSFSFRCDRSGLEYSGTNLNTLFAQRTNLLSPGFWKMIWDILRFNRQARNYMDAETSKSWTVGEFIQEQNYSQRFMDDYLLPMAASIWSARTDSILSFPADSLLAFFDSHGLLQLSDRPEWRFVRGGSREYVEQLIKPFEDSIHYETPVRAVRRTPADDSGSNVRVETEDSTYLADAVVLACHGDQAFELLEQPTDQEANVLEHFEYKQNTAYLHTDRSLLPESPRAHAAWNYRRTDDPDTGLVVTYNLNRLMDLETRDQYLVTLNAGELVDPESVIDTIPFRHPQFHRGAFQAQEQHNAINGTRNTYYCGAYWGYGFHEDGVQSARRVARALGVSTSN